MQTSQEAECPVAPERKTTVYTRTLHRACQLVGGIAHLAKLLHVPEHILDGWLEGREDPPTSSSWPP